ncbi:subtilisin-like serine protease [Pseudomonas sp. BAY1663]|nr:subtilisin-like serine protease [Pseudomonas sp. BAY1663]
MIEETAAEGGEQETDRERPPSREWAANRFLDAVDYYRERIPAKRAPIDTEAVRIGVIERAVDFDAPNFAGYLQPCDPGKGRTCLYARDADKPDSMAAASPASSPHAPPMPATAVFSARWTRPAPASR